MILINLINISSLYSRTINITSAQEIQKAIDKSQKGDVLLLKSGVYSVKYGLSIAYKEDLTIKGVGNVQILLDDPEDAVIEITKSSNIYVINIRASHKEPVKDPSTQDSPYVCTGHVITIEESKNVNILNCELNGCGTVGVAIYSSKKVLVNKCYIHNNSHAAIKLSNTKNINISQNRIENNKTVLNKELSNTNYSFSENTYKGNKLGNENP